MSNKHPASDRRLGWAPLDYSVEIAGKSKTVELPFVVAVIADVSGGQDADMPRLRDRKFRELDVDNLDPIMRGSHASVSFKVKNWLLPGEEVKLYIQLQFERLDDFSPGQVAHQIEPLARLIDIRSRLASLEVHMEVNPEIENQIETWLQESKNLDNLKQSIDQSLEGDVGKNDNDKLLAPPWLSDLLTDHAILYLGEAWHLSGEKISTLNSKLIAEIDNLLSTQLNEVLHHTEFQRLEATWRGLDYLARQTESGSFLKLRLLHATKKEIQKDLAKAVEFDQSDLFKKLYDQEANAIGGEPYGLIVCDYDLSHSPEELNLLSGISNIAAACQAPALFGTSPKIFGMDSWNELRLPRDLKKIFESPEYAKWRNYRDEPDASYVSLVLPRLLARIPWNTIDNISTHGFAYEEKTEISDDYLWMNGAFGFAAVVTNAFARDRWCIDLRGPQWGRMDGLPAHYIIDNAEITEVIGPTEIDILDRRHPELEELGFTSLTRHRKGDFAAVLTPTSLYKAKIYDTAEYDIKERLSVQLEHRLVVGRISHVIRSYLMNHSSFFGEWETVIDHTKAWLSQFLVNPSESGGETDKNELMLQAPFRSIDVRLGSDENRPDPTIEIDIKLNYLPKGEPVSQVLITYPPPGILSSRLVP